LSNLVAIMCLNLVIVQRNLTTTSRRSELHTVLCVKVCKGVRHQILLYVHNHKQILVIERIEPPVIILVIITKYGILTPLAHTRDGVLTSRKLVAERNDLSTAGGAQPSTKSRAERFKVFD